MAPQYLLASLQGEYRNVPLRVLTVDAEGKAVIDSEALLTEREQSFKIDTNKPFKLNAGTTVFVSCKPRS